MEPHFIEHIVEPTKLLITWQSSDEQHRTRYIIAELLSMGETINLKYLVNSSDFLAAQKLGFESYPAFRDINNVYEDSVLSTFMRRLPPSNREDYPEFLKGFRINPEVEISNFALLGYTGARLPSDGFAIINTFDNINIPFEFLLEVAGYRYYKNVEVKLGDRVDFIKNYDSSRKEDEIKIIIKGELIGYVTRALLPSFQKWLDDGWIKDSWIEKKNGSLEQPVVFLYVKVSPSKL